MHRVLLINEILHNIAELSTHRECARLVRTCHVFHDAVLPVLWAVLPSISSLLSCLPSSLCKRTKQSQGDRATKTIYKLLRIFTPSDWAILIDHAQHVVTLQFLRRNNEDIDINFFRIMAFPPIIGFLFPKLKQLNWNVGRLEAFPFLRILLGPSTTTLSFNGNMELDMQSSAIIASLGGICPSLRKLDFLPLKLSSNKTAVSALSQAIASWGQLHELGCHSLNEEAIHHLAGLQSLISLEFHLPGTVATALVKSPLHDGAFASLSYLAIDDSRGFEAIAKLLRTVYLQAATLSFSSTTNGIGIPGLWQALLKSCNKDTLKDLTVKESRGGRDEPLEYQISHQTLRPLFCYRRIHSLTIDTPRSVTLDDASLINIGKAWPQLSFLHINAQNGWIIPSHVTFKGLASLLGLCPKLENLALAIDTVNINDNSDNDDRASNYVTSGLVTLNVLDSELAAGDVLEVASFLSDIAPDLDYLIAWDDPLGEEEEATKYGNRWNQVFASMGSFMRARKMERKRWTGRTSPTVDELFVSDDDEGSQGDSQAESQANSSSTRDVDGSTIELE